MNTEKAKVWGIHVGEKGGSLEVFNQAAGPFPPEPGTEGLVAIGWPAIGDMRLYAGNYQDFVNKFRIMYPHELERTFMTRANMVWNFAYGVKADDWVICPSSTAGYLLAGKVIGEYVSSFKGAEIPAGARQDFVHMRKVRWLYVASKSDPRYKALHRIGILTVNQQKYGLDELQKILNGHLPSV